MTAKSRTTTRNTTRNKNAAIVDAQLERYRSMRDFSTTPEPSGAEGQKASGAGSAKKKVTAPERLPFVIQKHAATRLHYDFRLAWNGVLKSWAIPKGPSYRTKDKRLAAQVEDHPMEYGGFEGIIPKGGYGGGTVMLWDTGTWQPQPGHTDVDAGLRDGSLKFTLYGKKMKGNWALIRMGGKAASSEKPQWLLIKEHDSHEHTEDEPEITEQQPDSVATGRSMEQIATDADHTWKSNRPEKSAPALEPAPAKQKAVKPKKPANSRTQKTPQPLQWNEQVYPKEKLPSFIPPQLAYQSDEPLDQAGWIHELKLDGYRIQAHKSGNKVELLTRTGLDWTRRMPAIAAEVAALPVESAILDGEVVVLEENGSTSFAQLQAAFREGEKYVLTYFVFDLLHCNGRNLRNTPLIERKSLLSQLLNIASQSHPDVRLSEHLESSGTEIFQHACALRAEGIVSKQASGKYVSGRSRSWLKIKCAYDQEFVIGGFTLPSDGKHGVGALLLGYYDAKGRLIYAGRTGTGFTQKTHRILRDQLEKLRVKQSPFDEAPAEARRGAIWVKPQLVAQVSFATWTQDKLVRQAAFKGLREDKPAKDVRREDVVHSTAKQPTKKASHSATSLTAAKSNPGPRSRKSATSASEPQEHAAVRLTHPDKILDTESGLTKQQLADYFWVIADHLLPHIANRPLSLVRCPEGSTSPCFFQKHTNAMLPKDIETVQVPDKKTGKPEPYITVSTRESLAGLAQMGVLELHPWGSQNDNLERPDRIVIDLDPDEAISWPTLAESAAEVRGLFKQKGLESFLKITGGKGLHVVVPITPEQEWPTVKAFAHEIALELERRNPALYLTKMSKAARKGKIFVDYLRNERGATSVAAFSPRARAGAPVSMPLKWSELNADERPVFHVADFDTWKARLKNDPWKNLTEIKQSLPSDAVSV
ncbi:MAG TPA: DNA ligase D [Acidobacteriaceae bacterium]|jgi:bifunctional non-homologous end joining protein LigD|nr:DNA ligase D [Acidobacteriaceae bacterium]